VSELHIVQVPISQEMREEIDMANWLRESALRHLTPEGRAFVEEFERRDDLDLLVGKGNA
jgi:hypothetical protein